MLFYHIAQSGFFLFAQKTKKEGRQMLQRKKFLITLIFSAALFVMLPKSACSAVGVIITDDDGERVSCEILQELANKYGIIVNLGIVAGYIGYDEYFVTEEQIRSWASQPFVKFASHTMTHPYLTDLPENELDWELGESKRLLEKWTGRPINTLFYPYGEYGAREIEHAKKFFRFARRAWPSDENWLTPYNSRPYDLMELETIYVWNGDSPEIILDEIREAKSRGAVIILLFHLIVDGSTDGLDEYYYPKSELKKIFQGIKDLGVPSLSFGQAFSANMVPVINLLLLQ